MWRRVIALVVVVLVVGGAVWYGQASPRSAATYQARAEETAEALRSQARAAELWVSAVAEGTVTRAAASVAIEDAETDARSTASRFAGWDPPPELAGVGGQLTGAASQVVDALAAVRVAAHEGQWDTLSQVAAPLRSVADRLDGQLASLRQGSR